MSKHHTQPTYLPTPPPSGNVSELLFEKAEHHPDRVAIVFPDKIEDLSYSYCDIKTHVCTFMAGLRANDIKKEDRIVLLFPVSLELYTLIAAIYAVGAVAVLIDPGMGVKRILSAIKTAKPKGIISGGTGHQWTIIIIQIQRTDCC